jgi:predicted Zn finger-like uncharacterized protein
MSDAKIACPKCHSTFKVASDVLGSEGRKLKCSKCGNIWQAFHSDLLHFVEDMLKSEVKTGDWLIEKSPEVTAAAASEDPLFVEKLLNVESNASKQSEAFVSENTAIDFSISAQQNIDDIVAENKANNLLEQIMADHDLSDDEDSSSEETEDFEELLGRLNQSETVIKPKIKRPFYYSSQLLAAVNSAAFLLVMFLLLLNARDYLLKNIPATAAIYRLVGYHSSDNLQLADISFVANKAGGNQSYLVKGFIINNYDSASLVPTIRARLFDKYGDVVNEWQLAGKTDNNAQYSIPAKGEKAFKLKLPASSGSDLLLAIDIGSNFELDLRK